MPRSNKMLNRLKIVVTPPLVCLFLLTILLAVPTFAEDRPNIILIMSDDMGFSDIGCYGGEAQTPVLDQLADEGVRFTQFYNTGRCCPTRGCLLTGLYPHQSGIGHMMNDRGVEGYQGDLSEHCQTIAEVLRPAGYGTYMVGKWHVTKTTRPEDESGKHNWPLQRGFDRFFGTIHGAGSFYDPNSLTRDNTLIAPDSPDFFYTDAISENAAQFIQKHEGDEPFFMYVAYTAAHWPMHARPHNIEKYSGQFGEGYAHYREQRLNRLLDMGMIDPDWDLSEQAGDWADVENEEWEEACMEVYAAMIDCMDQGIGQIVDSLEETGELDNTLILFFQDNGGCAEGMGRGGNLTYRVENPEEIIPMQPGELQYDMIPRRTRDGLPLRQGAGVMPGPADTYIGYGKPWANVSNTPFREYKHWVHEGGISTPLIAHWPAGIPESNNGRLESQPGHLIDLMATCVDLGEAEYPSEVDGSEIRPMEGTSLVPAFLGEDIGREAPIFWEHERNCAIRVGKWKLVGKGILTPDGPDESKWELFDMEADRTEMHDLAAEHPERVRDMSDQWIEWAHRAHVLPYEKPKN